MQFSFHVFRHGKVVGNVETAAVVTGIAVRASYSAPYHYVHVFFFIRDLMHTRTQLFLRPQDNQRLIIGFVMRYLIAQNCTGGLAMVDMASHV